MSLAMPQTVERLNARLAKLLGYGTWVACGFILVGMILSLFGLEPAIGKLGFVSAGIVLLIALPTIRVATMGLWFLFHRDFDFAVVAGVVLTIIIVATFLGLGAA